MSVLDLNCDVDIIYYMMYSTFRFASPGNEVLSQIHVILISEVDQIYWICDGMNDTQQSNLEGDTQHWIVSLQTQSKSPCGLGSADSGRIALSVGPKPNAVTGNFGT